MCNTLSTALQAAGNLASIPLFDPAMTDSNTKKVMQEALAIVLWKNEPYTLRLYLCAVFNSELTGNTESGANTRLATLMKERCPASTLCLLLDDDYDGTAKLLDEDDRKRSRTETIPEANRCLASALLHTLRPPCLRDWNPRIVSFCTGAPPC